jgi:hypothetical protein
MSVQVQSQPEVHEYSRRVGASEGRARVTAKQKASQQSVYLTLGTAASRRAAFLGFIHTSAESCFQTESTPAPAQVTQTVGLSSIPVSKL